MEIMFTSLHAIKNKNYKLIGQTSMWMFPIYGLAVFIKPVYRLIKDRPIIIRGGIYSLGIITCEYISGTLLKKRNLCPWDYSKAKANIDGVIRLDYLPVWMAVGLIFEHILTVPKASRKS